MSSYRSNPRADELTGAQRVVDELLSHIHEGLIFKAAGTVFTISDGGDDDFLILTPAAPTLVQIVGLVPEGLGGPWVVELRGAPTVSNPGAQANIFRNMNQNSEILPQTLLYDNATLSNDGDFLDQGMFGGSEEKEKASVGDGNYFHGWLLKPATYYNFHILNLAPVESIVRMGLYLRETISQ